MWTGWSSAAGDRRCILICLSVWVWLENVKVVCFLVCKCIHDPNGVCILLPGCLDRMLGGNVIGLASRGDPGPWVGRSPRLRFACDLIGSGSRSDIFRLVRYSFTG